MVENGEENKQQIENIIKECSKYHNQLRRFCSKDGKAFQRRYESLNENQAQVLKQIDVAKDMLFLELCKRQKHKAQIRKLVRDSLEQDWGSVVKSILEQYEKEVNEIQAEL